MSPLTDWGSLAKNAKDTNQGFEPAPDGNYDLTITAVEIKKSGAGNKKFATTCVIDSGQFKNKKVWHDFVVAEKSLRIFFENMAVFGMPYEFFNSQTQDEEVVANLLNKRFSADLVTDEWEGKKKNKVGAGWTIKAPKTVSELGNSSAGVPGGATVSNEAPPAPTYQQTAPAPAQQTYQAPPVVQQPQAPAYQQPPAIVDPWQTPPAGPAFQQEAPPPPPPGSTWGPPPPPPPSGLSH